MVRAKKVAWLGIVITTALASSRHVEAEFFGPSGAGAAPEQGPTWRSSAKAALARGIASFRQGDYEAAASAFYQGQQSQQQLSEAEQQELAHWVQLSGQALQEQQRCAELLRQAEIAIHDGRFQEADNLLKNVRMSQFLSPGGKKRAADLTAQLGSKTTATATPAALAGATSPAQLAQTKLQQARALMAKHQLDAAEALAREAGQLETSYQRGEDTPVRVLNDIAQQRTDPAKLLAAAREAVNRGDCDAAAQLAREADKAAGPMTFMMKEDTPARVLKDISERRARLAGGSGGPSPDTTSQGPGNQRPAGQLNPASSGKPPAAGIEQASYVEPALAAAAAAATPALDLAPPRLWNTNDSPQEKRELFEQARRAREELETLLGQHAPSEEHANPTTPPPSVGEPAAIGPEVGPDTNVVGSQAADPHELLKMARQMYNAERYDEAEQMAQAAQGYPGVHWSLFEGTPGKLLSDLRLARAQHHRRDSVEILARARRLFQQGDLEGAREQARLADQLHGPTTWDKGDRPQQLLAEIDAAQRGRTQQPLPPEQEQPVVQGPAPPSQPADLGPNPVKQKAAQLLAEARRLQQEGRLVEAYHKALEAQKTRVAFGAQEDSPDRALAQLQGLATARIANFLQEATDLAAGGYADATRYDKAEKDLTEARQLATGFGLDCQPVDAKFGWVRQVREKGFASASPASAVPQPANVAGAAGPARESAAVAQVTHRHDAPGVNIPDPLPPPEGRPPAKEFGPDATGQPQPVAKGPDLFPAARPLGNEFDPPPTDQPQPVAKGSAQVPAAPLQPGVKSREQQGLELLEQARLELRNGQTGNARRLAEQAYKDYGVQAEAEAVLRTIGGEEYNQRVLLANRAFEAGMSLYRRKDYTQANTIFRGLDVTLLEHQKQARLREVMQTPEMQPRTLAKDKAKNTPEGITQVQGKATASDTPGETKIITPEENYAQQVQALADVQFQKLRWAGIDAQRKATERFQHGDPDEALQLLQEYLASLRDSSLEPERVAMLQRPVEARLQQFKALKAEQEIKQAGTSPRDKWNREHERERRADELKQQQVTDLMKQYHALYKEAKYHEAEVTAMKALDLDPDNAQCAAAVQVARMHASLNEHKKDKENKEYMVLHGLNDTDKEGPFLDIRNPEGFDDEHWKIARNRKPSPVGIELTGTKSEREREIERQLTMPTSINFKDTPLKEVLKDLSAANNINIVPDEAALLERGISLKEPMSMEIAGVQLKSALNLLLSKAHLTFVIKDEVLWITTEDNARGKMVRRVFPVADIVIPVQDHRLPDSMNLQQVIQNAAGTKLVNGGQAGRSRGGLQNGDGVGSPTYSQSDPGKQWAVSASEPAAGTRAPGQTIQDVLIDLITNTIQPDTWSKAGGHATIEYFPLGMALVVNQTPDIQEQVQELLAALRRLQDQEVAVEVRFITLDEAFYERIGVDFAVNITNRQSKYAPQLVTGNFAGPGQINAFTPSNFFSGITAANAGSPGAVGAFTPDLGFPIHPGSFGPAVPPFGGFQNAIPDGGLSLGLAFLSDIQVFMLMEAAQGDRRSNVMQAPKLTLFNGQTATITIQDQQYFVTNVQVVEDGGQVVFIPQNQAFPTGVSLSIQAVITGDRRFVRLSLQPNLTNLSAVVTALFPVTTFITPVFDGGAQGQPVPFTQYLQQPNFSTITVETTVMVPDGGTVLLGGLKTLREGRNEFGPPILSQLPYINRLFKNVGYGREAQSLMLMVTPRIIIQEEEETIQTGVGTGLGLAAGAGGGQELAGGAAPGGGPGGGAAPPR